MKANILLGILCILTVAATPAEAKCLKEPVTTADMVECATFEYRNADLALNQTYQGLMKHLDSAAKQKLVNAEKAWIQFRDKNCVFYGDFYRGGSLQPVESASCLTRMTEERTRELQSQIDFRDSH